MESVGDEIQAGRGRWNFDGTVASTFDSHVVRSVPQYREMHQLAVDLSDFFVKKDSLVYDLGCSTGTLTRLLAEHNLDKTPRIVGIDSVPEMLSTATAKESRAKACITYRCEDLIATELDASDYVVMFYTLQFTPPSVRQSVVDRIYKSLNWGGAFLLVEKVRGPDARFQDIATALYEEFKLRNGFEPAESAAKTRSLRGVLEPFSSDGNRDLLRRAGFVDVMSIAKHICFEAFLAIK